MIAIQLHGQTLHPKNHADKILAMLLRKPSLLAEMILKKTMVKVAFILRSWFFLFNEVFIQMSARNHHLKTRMLLRETVIQMVIMSNQSHRIKVLSTMPEFVPRHQSLIKPKDFRSQNPNLNLQRQSHRERKPQATRSQRAHNQHFKRHRYHPSRISLF